MKNIPRSKGCYYCEQNIPAGREVKLQRGDAGDKLFRHKDCPLVTKVKKKVKLIKRNTPCQQD